MRNRWLVVALLLGVVLVGCAKKAPPVVPRAVVRVSMPVAKEEPAETPDTPETQFTPAQLAQKLQDQDAGVRVDAARALGELGDKGYSHLALGLQHTSAEVRAAALEGLTPALVRGHQKELVPLLLKVFEEKDATMRRRACTCLAWPDQLLLDNQIQAGAMVKERLTALKTLATEDKDATVRAAALASAQSVQQAILGKIDRTALKSPIGAKDRTDPRDKSDPRSAERPIPKRELPR
jgi:hypothetical protein